VFRMPTSLRQPRTAARMLASSVLLLRCRTYAADRVGKRRVRPGVDLRFPPQSVVVHLVDIIAGRWYFSFSSRVLGLVSESRRRLSQRYEVITVVVHERGRFYVRRPGLGRTERRQRDRLGCGRRRRQRKRRQRQRQRDDWQSPGKLRRHADTGFLVLNVVCQVDEQPQLAVGH